MNESFSLRNLQQKNQKNMNDYKMSMNKTVLKMYYTKGKTKQNKIKKKKHRQTKPIKDCY